MGEIINLKQARKARDKAEAKATAAANRAAHGRTKGEKSAAEIERARIQRLLDQSRRED